MNWIQIAIAVLQLIPAVIKAMKALEAEIPQENVGTLKLGVIKGTLASITDKMEELWPYLEKAINLIVDVFNKTGVFQTSKQVD